MNIYEHHEVLGWFFLPEDPDNRVPGVLKWDPAKGAEIELMGGFSSLTIPPLEPGVNCIIIDGIAASMPPAQTIYLETEAGKKYSIWDSWRSSYSSVIPGKPCRERWLSRLVYVGDHVLSEDKNFAKATFYIDELYYLVDGGWILSSKRCQMEGLERPGEKLESGTCLTPSTSLVMGGLQAGIFEGNTEGAHYSINLLQTPRFTRQQRYGAELAISFKASVHITLRNQEKVEDLAGRASDFVDNFAPIRDLMCLATFQRCGVSSINLEQKNKDGNNDYSWLGALGIPYDEIGPPPADYGFMLIKSRFGEVVRPYEFHESKKVVFTLNDISLENFLKERERLTRKDGAFDPWVILIGLCGYIPNYMEEYISQSFAAAEGFHKLCLGKDGHLKKRLEDLYSLLPQKIRNQIKFDDNIEIWAELAANVRHRAAHGGPQDGRNNNTISDVIKRYVGTLSISDCNAVAASAHLVTYLVLLNELGVSSEAICNALNIHPKISTMAYYCSKVRSLLESIKNLPTS